jgi:hypothetical protein
LIEKQENQHKRISPVIYKDMTMPAYYFAMEGYQTGETPDPAVDKLITVQYQKIDLTNGEPLDDLVILKEWKSSEQSIVNSLYHEFFKKGTPVTHFIPVGMNLDYAYEMIIAKFKKYNLPAITSRELYYERPRFDLKPIIVLLNDGRWTGASLDSFSSKKGEESHVKKWYDKQEFDRIEHHIRDEAERFLKLLHYLSKHKTRMGITKKEGPVHQKTPNRAYPASVKKTGPSPKKSPAGSTQTGKKPAKDGKHMPQKGSVPVTKMSRSPQKSAAKKAAPDQKLSRPLNQFRKYTPTKKGSGKRE